MTENAANHPDTSKRTDIPVEKRPYGAAFFVLSMILALGTLWAVADEVIVRRPWKEYQRAFNQYEYDMLAARRDSLIQALEQEEAGAPEGQSRAALEAQLAGLRRELEGSAEYRELQAELDQRAFDLFKINREYQFTKSNYDEKFYLYTETKHKGRDYSRREQEIDRLQSTLDSLLPLVQAQAARRDSVQTRIDEMERPVDSLAGLIQGKTQEITRLAERMQAIQARPLKVHQVILPDYEPNEFENPIIRVDRCQSCHVGIDKEGFESAPQPFTTHPRREEYFGAHPPEKFGCTPCHDGQGPALTVQDAHSPKKYWDYPMLAGHMVEAGCQKCHSNRAWLDNAGQLMDAQKKLRRLGCVGCHDIEGYNDLAKVAPPLDRVKTKLTSSWLYDWVKNPKRFRPDTRMPNFLMPDSEAVAIVAYLETVSADKPAANWPVANRRGDAKTGRDIVKTVGCLGCHHIDDLAGEAINVKKAAEIDHGPNLSRIGDKVDAAWLYGWLKNPRAYNPETRMPSLRLTDQETADVTAYLTTLSDSYSPISKPADTRPRDYLADQGEYWVRTYGCFGCHTIPGMEGEGKVSVALTTFGAKDVTELAFGDATDIPHTWEGWTLGKLKNSRLYETKQAIQRMPDFAMDDEDSRLFLMLLKSFDGRKVYEEYRDPVTEKAQKLQRGRILAEHYNCTGCHSIEGRGGDITAYIADRGYHPPNLTPEGAKVQSDWLFTFLQNPTPIRPWLDLRMPTFHMTGEEITSINQYFMALNDVVAPFMYLRTEDLDPESVRAGRSHFQGFQCASCHPSSDQEMRQMMQLKGAANLAPNLALARTRLRPDWIIDWLTDPQRIDPGTNMPSFFYSEGERLYDDADEQIRALRDYLLTIGTRSPTSISQR